MNEFLDDLFGEQEGIIYAPVIKGRTKQQPKGTWNQHFFEWPQEREKLEQHIERYNDRDIYIAPALFTERRISPETFKGTFHLWSEFDGVLPSDYIEPTIRLSSSTEGHEHWFWRLNEFTTDIHTVTDITKRIAYAYGADLSVHDYQNVLRVPDTWNHKNNKPVTLLSKTEQSYSIEEFLWLPIVDTGPDINLELGGLPKRDQILAKYKWQSDTLDLLFKEVDENTDRSNALYRLAADAVETGCSNEEVYVLIEDRDRVWGKYLGRTDRDKQLQNIISRIRSKKATVTSEITHGTPEVYRFWDFMKTDIKLQWVIEGLLPVAGSMVIFGKPGIGKSTFSLRVAMALGLGWEQFLAWKVERPQRTLFISLEMQHYELKSFFEDMQLSEQKHAKLQENFFVWPIGTAYPLDTPDQQIELLKYIDLHKIELIVIDSLSLALYGSVSNDDDIKRLNSFLNEDVRRDRKCGYIFIHHPRKDPNMGEKKDLTQDDSYGAAKIVQNAQTVMILSQKTGSTKLHVHLDKTRMMVGAIDFDLERTPDRGFQLVGGTKVPDSSNVINGEVVTDKDANVGALGPKLVI